MGIKSNYVLLMYLARAEILKDEKILDNQWAIKRDALKFLKTNFLIPSNLNI